MMTPYIVSKHQAASMAITLNKLLLQSSNGTSESEILNMLLELIEKKRIAALVNYFCRS